MSEPGENRGHRRGHPVREPGAPALDPERPRSMGPLDATELALCRDAGIPLAYDPLQIGWVTAACHDDFADDTRDASDTQVTRPRSPLEERLVEQALGRLRAATRRGEDRSELAPMVWSIAEALVAEADLPPAHRLDALHRLQARAHAFAMERLSRPGTSKGRRHAALVAGHDYVLRTWRAEDAPRFRALLDDPLVWTHLPEDYPDPLTVEMARDLIELSNADTRHEVRAVEWQGEVIGQVRMLYDGPFGTHDGSAVDGEISYWLGRAHWGQGHVSALIPLFTLLTFQRRPLASIFARVARANVASRRALERAGYLDEGDLSAALTSHDGTRTLRCFRAEYIDPSPSDARARPTPSTRPRGAPPVGPQPPG